MPVMRFPRDSGSKEVKFGSHSFLQTDEGGATRVFISEFLPPNKSPFIHLRVRVEFTVADRLDQEFC